MFKIIDHPEDQHAFNIHADLGSGLLKAKVEYLEKNCSEHPDCTVITMRQEGRVLSIDGISEDERQVFESEGVNFKEHTNGVVWCPDPIEVDTHIHNSIHTEHVLNTTYPRALGKNGEILHYSLPCKECISNEFSPW